MRRFHDTVPHLLPDLAYASTTANPDLRDEIGSLLSMLGNLSILILFESSSVLLSSHIAEELLHQAPQQSLNQHCHAIIMPGSEPHRSDLHHGLGHEMRAMACPSYKAWVQVLRLEDKALGLEGRAKTAEMARSSAEKQLITLQAQADALKQEVLKVCFSRSCPLPSAIWPLTEGYPEGSVNGAGTGLET